jgi:hypothetical protein
LYCPKTVCMARSRVAKAPCPAPGMLEARISIPARVWSSSRSSSACVGCVARLC